MHIYTHVFLKNTLGHKFMFRHKCFVLFMNRLDPRLRLPFSAEQRHIQNLFRRDFYPSPPPCICLLAQGIHRVLVEFVININWLHLWYHWTRNIRLLSANISGSERVGWNRSPPPFFENTGNKKKTQKFLVLFNIV